MPDEAVAAAELTDCVPRLGTANFFWQTEGQKLM